MQSILIANIHIFILEDIFHFDANKRICFCFKKFLFLYKFKNEYDLTSALYLHIPHLLEQNQMLIGQLKSGKGQIM